MIGRYNRKGISLIPSLVSISGALICIFAGLMASRGESLTLAAIIYVAGSAFDQIDGRLDRRLNRGIQDRFNEFVDSMSDKIGEIGFLVGLMLRVTSPDIIREIGITALLGLLTSHVKAVSMEYGIDADWSDVTVFGRGLRVIIVSLGLIITVILGLDSNQGIFLVTLVLGCFNLLTFGRRLFRIIKLYIV